MPSKLEGLSCSAQAVGRIFYPAEGNNGLIAPRGYLDAEAFMPVDG
jgi:hypothetical protein